MRVFLAIASASILSCTKATPQLTMLSSNIESPTFSGSSVKTIEFYTLSLPVDVSLSCDARVMEWFVSIEGGPFNDIASVLASGTSAACKKGSLDLKVDPSTLGFSTSLAQGASEDKDITIKGRAAFGETTPATLTLHYMADTQAPTLTLTSTAPSAFSSASFTVTAKFSEPVAGFDLTDVKVSNGSASVFSGSGTTYSFTVTPANQGTVTVAVGAGAAKDLAGLDSLAATSLTRVYDTVHPSVQLTSTASAQTNVSPIPVTVTFSEPVMGFDSSDVVVANGVITGFTGSGANYSLNVTPTVAGTVTVRVAAGVAADAAGNANNAATDLSRNYDQLQPAVTISTTTDTYFKTQSFIVNVTFSKAVTGFALGDINVTNGTASTLTIPNSTSASFKVTPAAQGVVTVSIAANAVSDSFGNASTASNTLSRTYDTQAPTLTLATDAPASFNSAYMTVTASFSEAVTGFAIDDLSITNGVASNFSGSGANYTFRVTPSGQGTVTVAVGAGAAADAAGNASAAASNLTRSYDSAQPGLTLTTTAPDSFKAASFTVNATFSKAVTGFDLSDIKVTNGTASTFAGSGSGYTFKVTPTGQGLVTVSVGAGAATDAAGNTSAAAVDLTRTYDSIAPTLALATDASATFNSSSISVSATFSEAVTGFTLQKISVTNGVASNLIGTGGSYTFSVTPSGQGLVTVAVAAGAATDAAGNTSTAATNLTRTYDSIAPTVVLATASASVTATPEYSMTATFSEPVAGFSASGLDVSNGSVSGFSGSGTTYFFTVTASAQGAVSVAAKTGAGHDAGGNGSIASTALTRTYDSLPPTDPGSIQVGAQPTQPLRQIPTITFTPSDDGQGSGVQKYQLRIYKSRGDTLLRDWFDAAVTAGANNSLQINYSEKSDFMADGESYYVKIRAMDLAGNVSDGLSSAAWTIVLDPCAGNPTIGTSCTGGAIYLGQLGGAKYMTTPSGCTDAVSPTCAGGTDAVLKTWNNGGGGGLADIAGVETVTAVTTPSSSSFLGDVNTLAILAKDANSEAAKYCSDLVYGGYSDWYLPSKTELAYMYCKSTAPEHSDLYPQEDPNCVNFGGQQKLLGGFSTNLGDFYWSSTEAPSQSAWGVYFKDGGEAAMVKNTASFVRCVRSY